MVLDGKAFAIQTGIFVGVCLAILLGFSIYRRLRFTRKFFAPKRYPRDRSEYKPPRLRNRLDAWIRQVIAASEEEVIRSAGVDAAMYIKVLRMGCELFLVVGFLCLAASLPTNLTSNEVNRLMNAQEPICGNSCSPACACPVGLVCQQGGVRADTGTCGTVPSVCSWPANTETRNCTSGQVTDPTTACTCAQPFLACERNVCTLVPNNTADYTFSDLDKTTLSNIPDRSSKLYVHAVLVWLVTGVVFWQLWRYNKVALRLRVYYLLNTPKGAESHTVLLTDIPGVQYGTMANRLDRTALRFLPGGIKRKIRESATSAVAVGKARAAALAAKGSTVGLGHLPNSPRSGDGVVMELRDYWGESVGRIAEGEDVQHLVETEMKKVYGTDVAKVHMVHNTSVLDGLVSEYEKLERSLTDLVDDLISKKRRGKKVKPAMTRVLGVKYGNWGKEKYGVKPVKVDALEWYRDRLTELWRLIGEEQQKALGTYWPSAFVTFESRKAQVSCSDALICQDLSMWRAQAAPPPEEVYWKNLGLRQWERSMRSIGIWTAYVALILFFMIPVGAVQALMSLSSVTSFVNSIPIVGTMLTGILPTLALTIFLALLPMIIRLMNIVQGMRSEGEIDMALVSRFFAFQVVTVFFGSFIIGSFANQIKQFIEDPASIVTVLGTAAPQTAIFFMSFVQLQALVVQPIGLLRIVPLLLFLVLTRLSGTERAKQRLWRDQQMTYGTLIPGDSIAMLLGLVFCVVCPIITPIALLYFAITYLIWKYQMLYVYGQPYQTGGRLWMRVFDQVMVGTILFQLMMIFLLAIKKVIAPAIICIPPAIFTIFFWHTVHAMFWRPQQTLSLMVAAELDAKEDAQEASDPLLRQSDAEMSSLYQAPAFKKSESAHLALLAEAEKGMKILRGEEGKEDLEEQQDDDQDDGPAPAYTTSVEVTTMEKGSLPAQP